jgi:putative ABC transport system ATP-binding protein
MDLLTRLNRDQGITIIMVTHESDIAAYADRVVRFVDGRIASDQPNREAA